MRLAATDFAEDERQVERELARLIRVIEAQPAGRQSLLWRIVADYAARRADRAGRRASPKRGIKAVRKTLADGSRRTYYYSRQTGRPLGTDRAAAIRSAANELAVE